MTDQLEHEAFTVIVVPLDLEPDHDRAMAVAAGLAAAGDLPIILLTVSSPGLSDLTDQIDLRRTAEQHHVDRWSSIVLHDNDPARALSQHLSILAAPLVVMASGVRGMLSELSSADILADLLAEISGPALILGPQVPLTWQPGQAQLLCCLPPGASPATFSPWTDQWLGTFGGSKTVFITVEPSDVRSDGTEFIGPERVGGGSNGIADARAEWKVVYDDDTVNGLLSSAADVDDGLLVVTSTRWSDDSRLHRHSIARHLAHASEVPVLVLPRAVGRPT